MMPFNFHGSRNMMVLTGFVVSLPARLAAHRFASADFVVRVLAGVFGSGFGLWMIYEIGFVEGALRSCSPGSRDRETRRDCSSSFGIFQRTTVLRSAPAQMRGRMIVAAVVYRNLFARPDVAQGEEHHTISRRDAHKSVRVARVVDVRGRVAARRAVDRERARQRDDLDDALRFLLALPTPHNALAAYDLARIDADLLAPRNGLSRKAALFANAARFDLQRHLFLPQIVTGWHTDKGRSTPDLEYVVLYVDSVRRTKCETHDD